MPPWTGTRPPNRATQSATRHGAAEAGRDHNIGESTLELVRQLLSTDGLKNFRGHAWPAEDPLALQESRRAHHEDPIDPAVAPTLEQEWNVQHDAATTVQPGPP